ncbi:SgrR family transcriptional regulator [Paenibacillus sp. GD4]|uniref:ABC transporter substrate-binding protein n=1 Tax=Paenibacillus sp. GD4 TaxID=3068890 RepID=UPI002796986D|nr:ABC transporter substrate-binding protein [Paenibacillus sp. GD4]MDQ1910667.1 SgrR family transcriptional regulator [Paenibacillus sp. GD4]
MQLWEHYVVLYKSLSPTMEAHISLPELSVILSCTERNVKLLMRGMREQGWIVWSPGRGRGRRSVLKLLADPDKLLADQAAARLEAGQWSSLSSLLRQGKFAALGQAPLLRLLEQSLQTYTYSKGDADVLRFPTYRIVGGLDPAYVTRRTELHMVRQLFDTLVKYRRETGEFEAQLAHHWIPGERRWSFYLQKRVRFHDGTIMTSKDVAGTLLRLRETGPYKDLFRCIRGVDMHGDYCISIDLHEPVPGLLSLLASTAASIVPANREQDYGDMPIGTGPFRLSDRNERLLALEAHPDYFLRPAHLDQVEMWCFPELYDLRQQSRSEPLEEMNFQHYRHTERQEPWQEVERTDRGCKYIVLNQRKAGPLQRNSERKKLVICLTEEDIAFEAGGNRGPRARRLISEFDHDAEEKCPESPDEAPLPNEAIHLTAAIYFGGSHEADAEWLQEKLKARGIRLSIRLVPFEELTSDATLAWADLLLLELPVDEDAEWTLQVHLMSPAALLQRVLSDAMKVQLQQLLAPVRSEPSREKRLDALLAGEGLLLRTNILLPWYRWRQSASFPKELEGVRISSFGWVDYKELWFRS